VTGKSCHNEDMLFYFARRSEAPSVFLLKCGVVARPPCLSVFVLRQPYWPQLSCSLAVIVILPHGGGNSKTVNGNMCNTFIHAPYDIRNSIAFILIIIQEEQRAVSVDRSSNYSLMPLEYMQSPFMHPEQLPPPGYVDILVAHFWVAVARTRASELFLVLYNTVFHKDSVHFARYSETVVKTCQGQSSYKIVLSSSSSLAHKSWAPGCPGD
jgi:hypothetical protein